MFWLSIKARRRLWELSLALVIVCVIWFLQSEILSRFSLRGLFCNLPLTFTILWSSIFSSSLNALNSDDIRVRSIGAIAFYQAMQGSISGALIGGLFAAIYYSITPVYLISYPIIGWISGYFPLRAVQHSSLYSILLVLLATILGEFITACQLTMLGRVEAFRHFADIAISEAVLNALIAPFIFVPLKAWYDFSFEREVTVKS